MFFKKLILLLLSTVALHSAAASAEMMDRVLVIIDEDVITQSEFDYRMVTVSAEMQRDPNATVPPNLGTQLLESMIADRLQIQEARRRGIRIPDTELEAALARFAAAQKIDVAQLQQRIVSQGQSFQRFRESVRDSLTISRLTEYYARTRVVVPDYEIDGFIDQNDMKDAGTRYQIAHILIKNPDQNGQLADSVVANLRQGGNFQEAVLTYSEAVDAPEGGLIGWRTLDQLPEIFGNAIVGLQVGQVTNVLKSANGLHILKLLDLEGNRQEILQTKVRHILIKAESAIAKSQAAKKLLKVRQRIVDGESFPDLARIYSEDSVSAAKGGDLDWVSPGETVPAFEQTFQQSPLNQVSQPFESQYGVHILEVLDRRQKNVTDQVMRNRAANVLRRQRADREFEQWVRGLREQAYIEYVSEPA